MHTHVPTTQIKRTFPESYSYLSLFPSLSLTTKVNTFLTFLNYSFVFLYSFIPKHVYSVYKHSFFHFTKLNGKPEPNGIRKVQYCHWSGGPHIYRFLSVQFSSVQSLKHVQLFATPWTAAHRAFLPITNSQSSLKLMSIEPVMPCNPSHPLSSPSPPTFNISQHQGLFKWVSSLHQVAKVLEFQIQHNSFQWIFRTDFL